MVQVNGGGSEDNLNVPLDATAFLAVVSFFAVFLLVIFVYVNKKWRLLNVGATPGTTTHMTTKHVPLHSKAQYRSKIGEDYSSSPEPCFDQEDEEDVDLKRHHSHLSHHNHNQTQTLTHTQSYYQHHHLYSQHFEPLPEDLHPSNIGDVPRHPIYLSSSGTSSYYHYHEDDEEEFPESEGLYSTVRDVDGPVLRESSITLDKRMAHQPFSHTPPPPPPHSHQHSHGSYKTGDVAGPSSSNYVAHHSSSTPTSSSHHHPHHSQHHHQQQQQQQQQHMNASSAISASASTTVPSNTNTNTNTHTNISSNVKSSTPLTSSPGQGSCHSSLSHHSHSHSQSHGHGHGHGQSQSQSHRQGHSSSSTTSTPAMTNYPSSSEREQLQHQQNTQVIQHPYPASSEVRSIRPLRVSSIRDIDDMTMSTTSRRRPHHRGFTRSNTGPGRMMSRRESGNDLISLAEEGKINGGTGSESSTSSNASDDLHHIHNHHAHNGGSHLHHSRNESTLFHPHPLTLRHSNSVPSPNSNSNSNKNHNQNHNNNNNNNSSTSTSNSNYTTNNNSNIMNNNNNNNPSTSTTSNNHSISNQNSNPHQNQNQNHNHNNNNMNNNSNHVVHQNSTTNSASNSNTNAHTAIAGTSTGVNHSSGARGDIVGSQRNNPVISRSVAASSVNANQRRLMCMPPRIKSVDSESPPPSEQELSTYGDSIDDHIFEVEEMSLVGSDLGGLDVNRVPSTSLSLPCGSLEVAFDYEAAARKMTVHIIQARGVPSKDIGGSNNTQVRIVLLPNRKQKYKTKVLGGENPKFMESFVFSKINPEDVSSFGIRFRLYGCERILRRERLLGECILMFESLHLELETILWLSLEPRYEWKSRSQDLCRSDSASSTASIQNGIPELLVGLAYNGTTGRLTVEVIKGSFFRNLAGGKAPDSYVKLVLVSSTGHDMGRAKTSLRRSHSNPLFKETFMFQVALFQISEVTLLVSLYGRKGVTRRELLGWFAFGNSSSGDEETTHWEDMCDAGGDQICRWHVLLQS